MTLNTQQQCNNIEVPEAEVEIMKNLFGWRVGSQWWQVRLKVWPI